MGKHSEYKPVDTMYNIKLDLNTKRRAKIVFFTEPKRRKGVTVRRENGPQFTNFLANELNYISISYDPASWSNLRAMSVYICHTNEITDFDYGK
jgi:hypothetical protein